MPTLLDDFRANPTSSLVTIRCAPWHHRDRVVLLGDAAHAVVPFYGQGANAAFEDSVVLGECLADDSGNRGAALQRFYQSRKRHTDALASLAIDNFIEMRDRTESRVFHATKRLEKRLHRWFPRWFLPLYSMISFSRIPYADAVARARRQWAVVRGVAAGAGFLIFVLVLFLVKHRS